jgi:hypothetical protein
MKYVLILLAFTGTVWSASIRLMNDSSFKLRAVVRSADGTLLGEMMINAGQSMNWNEPLGTKGYGMDKATKSQTPYSVAWYCLDGGDFAFCLNAPSGGTVAVNSCDGLRTCKAAKPNQNQQQPPPQ